MTGPGPIPTKTRVDTADTTRPRLRGWIWKNKREATIPIHNTHVVVCMYEKREFKSFLYNITHCDDHRSQIKGEAVGLLRIVFTSIGPLDAQINQHLTSFSANASSQSFPDC